MDYEYLTKRTSPFKTGWKGDKPSSLDEELKEMNSEGWEFVALSLPHQSDTAIVVYRRLQPT